MKKEEKVAVDLKRMKMRAKVNLRHQLKQVLSFSPKVTIF